MTHKKVKQTIQEKFFEKLENKTSWGKEEVKKLFLTVQVDVLLDKLEEKKYND